MVAQARGRYSLCRVFPAESNARVRGALMEDMVVLFKNGFGRRALSGRLLINIQYQYEGVLILILNQ